MADEAKAASLAHKRWILEFMKQQPDMKCSYNALVEEGEKHHCNWTASATRRRTHAADDAQATPSRPCSSSSSGTKY